MPTGTSNVTDEQGRNGRILVVEDDARLRTFLATELETAGYRVSTAASVGEARFMLSDEVFDLVVLDRTLPDGDGIDVAEEARSIEGLAVLMLTARDDVDARVEGLYAGAADYVVKPFSIQELLARIHVRLRERRQGSERRHGDVVVEVRTSTVSGPMGVTELSQRECALLDLLVGHPHRLFSRDEIERRIYGPGEFPGSNTVEVFVHHVRKKLQRIGSTVEIRTVRGKGYMLR